VSHGIFLLIVRLELSKTEVWGVLEFVERVAAHTVNQSALPAPFCLSEMLGFSFTSIPFYTSSLTNSHRTKEAVSLRLPSKAPQPLLSFTQDDWPEAGTGALGLYIGARECDGSLALKEPCFKIRIFGTQSLPASRVFVPDRLSSMAFSHSFSLQRPIVLADNGVNSGGCFMFVHPVGCRGMYCLIGRAAELCGKTGSCD